MTERFLETSLEGDVKSAQVQLGTEIDSEWFQSRGSMEFRLRELRSDPGYAVWFQRAIVLTKANTMVGHIDFHTGPNPEYLRPYVGDGIEIGYAVYSDYRRRGIAQEAIRGLIGWAVQQHAVRQFVVSISPSNVPSTALAHKLGFARVGEWQDEVDGLEVVYLLAGERLAHFLDAR
jgi:RimJ/RimL family protein N-acetyltransferase